MERVRASQIGIDSPITAFCRKLSSSLHVQSTHLVPRATHLISTLSSEIPNFGYQPLSSTPAKTMPVSFARSVQAAMHKYRKQ